MGNNWLAKLFMAIKASTRFKTCSGTSIAAESMMIGASGMSRLPARPLHHRCREVLRFGFPQAPFTLNELIYNM
jgi:hypothetical protein